MSDNERLDPAVPLSAKEWLLLRAKLLQNGAFDGKLEPAQTPLMDLLNGRKPKAP